MTNEIQEAAGLSGGKRGERSPEERKQEERNPEEKRQAASLLPEGYPLEKNRKVPEEAIIPQVNRQYIDN